MKAAIYLGVAPWELAKQPIVWRDWALMAMGAEGRAEKTKIDRARAKAKRKGPK